MNERIRTQNYFRVKQSCACMSSPLVLAYHIMREKDAYLKALAQRNAKIRKWVLQLRQSKAEVGRMFGISRERVRQIVEQKD